MDAGDSGTAETLLLRAVRDGADDRTTYNLLGRVYWNQNKLKQAVEAYDQGIASDPSFEQSYLDLVRVLAAHNQWRPALEVARKSVQRFPNSATLWEFKGLAETMLLLTREAIASYTRALEIDSHSAKANLGLAVAQRAAGMTQKAAATFERGIREFPQDSLHLQEYGLMLLRAAQSGDTVAEARGTALLRQALTMDPKLSEAQYQLGNTLLNRGDTSAALDHLKIAAGLDPSKSKFQFALSRAYRRSGRAAEANEAFQAYERLKAIEEQSNPGFPAVRGQFP
jgi:tetratricopeptide (TPR) repeat protein